MSTQLPLFPDIKVSNPNDTLYTGKDLGTFKDSMRAPIHRWFRYPAGYSYKFVKESLSSFGVKQGEWVYDPFSGTGTTLLVAKQNQVNAYGVEAHNFVHWVADTKLYWEFDYSDLEREVEVLLTKADDFVFSYQGDDEWSEAFPELIYKCYHPQDIRELFLLRQFLINSSCNIHILNLAKLALTDTLRSSAAAGTGWPYIAPRKNTGDAPPKEARKLFKSTLRQMVLDLQHIATTSPKPVRIENRFGDSRNKQDLADNQVKLALTSPPYLNNYDYADRTRLETYFWGIAETWSDITSQFRDALITAATTQIKRSDYKVESALDISIQDLNPHLYQQIQESVLALNRIRLQKGGRKSYDLMVALYFNDVLKVIQETYRVLEKGASFVLVLGDSAPYGVHVETDNLIGELGLSLGFSEFSYYELRQRGDKWKENPQRHKVPLREGIVVLKK